MRKQETVRITMTKCTGIPSTYYTKNNRDKVYLNGCPLICQRGLRELLNLPKVLPDKLTFIVSKYIPGVSSKNALIVNVTDSPKYSMTNIIVDDTPIHVLGALYSLVRFYKCQLAYHSKLAVEVEYEV